jgi:hypothetical protein
MFVLPTVQRWNLGGKRFQRFCVENFTWGSFRKLVNVIDVMSNTSIEIYESRKKALSARREHDGAEEVGKDILTILSAFALMNTVSTEADTAQCKPICRAVLKTGCQTRKSWPK